MLCGSSPSFVVGQFMTNTAFYNRSENLIYLPPFDLMETNAFLSPKGPREVMLAAITTGGICEYLKQIKGEPSIYSGLCNKSFEPTSFFSVECDKVFVSTLSENKYYRKIIDLLANRKFADQKGIYRAVAPGKINSKKGHPGGSFTLLLDDLESLGFISKYRPVDTKQNITGLARYCISDEYLHFYFKFIKPKIQAINSGQYISNPLSAINTRDFAIVMGFSFERWCRKNERILARILNFGNVEYKAGPFFNRRLTSDIPGFQIDDRMEKIFDVIGSSDSYLYYPVVDELGQLQGVVGLEDLKPILGEQAAVREILVAYDLMENCSESITPGTPLQEAFNIMRKAQLGFLPVVEDERSSKLVGFLDHHVLDEKISREMLRRQQISTD